MARALFNTWLTDAEGDVVPNGTIRLFEVNGTTLLAAPMYAAASGGSPLGTTTLTANAVGYIEAYADAPQAIVFELPGGQKVPSGFWDRDPVTLTGIQTLTNKTLTSPSIATPTVTGGTFTAPTMSDVLLKGPMHDVEAYGAVPATGINGGTGKWEGTDAKAAFQAAHDAALADGGWVYFSGVFMWDSPINWNPYVPLVGLTDSASRIMPDTGCDGLPVIEVCGVQQGHATWLNFGIGDIAMPGRPSCPFIFAETAAHVNSSSEHFLTRVKVDGYYTKGTVFAAFASSAILDCIFHNNYDAAGISAVRFDNQAEHGVTSAFGYTYNTGSAVSDLMIVGTEVHDASGETDQYAIVVNGTGVGDFTFIKGIIGGTGTALIGLKNGPTDLNFYGTLGYPQDSGGSAEYALYAMDTDPIVSVNLFGGSSTIRTALVGGVAGCVYTGLKSKGHRIIDSGSIIGTPAAVSLTGNGGTITLADLDCYGFAVNAGAVSGSISGDLYYPGTITTLTRAVRVFDSDGGLTVKSLKTGLIPATTGAIRVSNNDSMIGRNAANDADVILLSWDTSNNLNLGSTSGMAKTDIRSTTGSRLDVAGTVRIEVNATGVGFNATAPIAKPALGADGSDPATTQALANAIKTALINYGLATA